MRIIGVHGIHNWSKSKSSFTDKILDKLVFACERVDVEYPRMLAVFGYFDWAIRRRAKKIAEANTSPHDILIAHSFGCLATIYAMKHFGARFSTVIFFAAAAESDIEIVPNFNILYNIHSSADLALKLGDLLPFHSFGRLGEYGYGGTLKNVVNVEVVDYTHHDYVADCNIERWSKAIADMINGIFDPSNAPLNMVIRRELPSGNFLDRIAR
jgi:hypothetical protein